MKLSFSKLMSWLTDRMDLVEAGKNAERLHPSQEIVAEHLDWDDLTPRPPYVPGANRND